MLSTFFWLVVVIVISIIFEMVRRKVIREKYAFVWLSIAVIISIGAIFPKFVNKISFLLGFQYLSNFVLFFLSVMNLLLIMQLTLSLGKVENESRDLAEEVALLRGKLENLK